MNYTQQQIDALIEGVYNGSITTRDLPVGLYNAISTKLLSALGSVEGSPSVSLLNQLKENIYMFSGAKVYQQIQEISLLANNETIKSYANFRDEALGIYKQYNKNWLETEYKTAIGQAQSATRWEQIEAQKFELPYLQYSAVIDKNTSDICKPLDGICLPVENKFWNVNTPLNHFNCRCTVIQFDKTDATQKGITPKEDADKATEEISKNRHPLFEGNSGKDRLIFNDKHPYFEVPKVDKEFAKTNFGLPIPQLESVFTPAKTVSEARTNILNIFEENLGIKGKSVGVSKDLTLADLNARSEQLFNLTKEYNIGFNKNSVPEIKFQSTGGAYGRVNYFYDGRLKSMNFGSRFDASRAIEDRIKITQTGFTGFAKSKVDFDKLNLSTLTHEFGHTIAVSDIRTDFAGFKDFWDEMKALKKAYNTEINKLATIKDTAKLNELYLGDYARTSVDEFLAEGFTEYKLKTNPSKYATEIGKTIDKYFKK
jgi:SPP1 gp7 family putative phage head morphogenesis protein